MLKTVSRRPQTHWLQATKSMIPMRIISRLSVGIREKHTATRQQIIHSQSLEDPVSFWTDAAMGIKWNKFPKKIYTELEDGGWKWFEGGKMNTAFNCLQKNLDEGRADQAALIWDSAYTNSRRKVTYRELDEMVNTFAGVLQDHGIQKGDTVIVYMPMLVEALVGMLACAKIGAVHSVVFGGFAGKELAKRIDDCKAKLILTASCGIEPNRVIPYMPLVEDALKIANHKPAKTIVFQRPQVPAVIDESKGQFEWQKEAKRSKALNRKVPYAPMESEDPLYVLYTSGTTGVPKGVVREHGGHAVALKWIMNNFMDAKPGDVIFAASDLGWVVGHTFICYGPLLNGCTSVVYEGKPVTPNPGAFFRIVEEHKVKILFTAPTALRAIYREDPHDHYLRMFDITSLKALFVAGERCDTDTATHYQRLLGVPVIDNYWQTETGYPILGVALGLENPEADKDEIDANAVAPVKTGVAGLPLPGYDVKVIDPQTTEELGPDEMGGIVVKTPLPPGVFRSLWKNPEGYKKSYLTRFPGYYDTSDAGFVDRDGYFSVMGRTDDIINGHRLSTGAMEEIVSEHPDVAECCVVGVNDKLKGEKPLGFVILKHGSEATPEQLNTELIRTIRSSIGPFACFDKVYVMHKLPKTRSGKILRASIRSIVNGVAYNAPATIEDPDVLKDFEELFNYKERMATASSA